MKITKLLLALCVVLGSLSCCFAEEAQAEDVVDVSAPQQDILAGVSLEALEGGEKQEFQAEISRLMEIIIHSLYSHKEIFLRELVSNAEDALDKARFLSLTDESILGDGDAAKLEIRIEIDDELKTVTITDTGIGMTKRDLEQNLGTVARSGTSRFLEAMGSQGGDQSLQLIGQFGVGFYSAYLVADRVTVVSKNNADDQYIWSSQADGAFRIIKDPRGNTLGRGTSVVLQLKEDATEFLQAAEIEKVVKRYSEFMAFPILLKVTKEVTEEVPIEEEEEEAAATTTDDESDELEVEEEDEDAEVAPKTRTITKTVTEFKRLNALKPLWTRSKNDITDEQYNDFFKSAIDKTQTEPPLAKSHFKAEGEIEFNSLLFIPAKPASDLYDNYYTKFAELKLYVRRVLVADKFEDFMPRYLNFVKGLVDSNDLPLNVNREQLQKSKVLKVIGKKVTRKALDMLRKLAEADEADEDDDDEDEDEVDDDSEKTGDDEEEVVSTYIKFWEQYGKSIKLGIMEDAKNKQKLAKLLRFKSTTSGDKWISLDQYIANNDETKAIYFIAGDSVDSLKKSPFLERFAAKKIEVLLFTDTLDEYFTQHLADYDGVKFQSITKEGINLGSDSKKAVAHFESVEEEFKPLTDYLKDTLGSRVSKVIIGKNLIDAPLVVSTGSFGWSANMERIVKAQAFGKGNQNAMKAQKNMELNYRHPVIRSLLAEVKQDKESATLKDLSTLLFDSALLQSGFQPEESDTLAARIQRAVSAGLKVDPNAKIEPELEFPEDEEVEEDDDEEEEEADEEDLDEADETAADASNDDKDESAEEASASQHDEL